MPDKISLRMEAAYIVELFEVLLDLHGISIPSDEDPYADSDNPAPITGCDYGDLLDNVTDMLYDIAERIRGGAEIVRDFYAEEDDE